MYVRNTRYAQLVLTGNADRSTTRDDTPSLPSSPLLLLLLLRAMLVASGLGIRHSCPSIELKMTSSVRGMSPLSVFVPSMVWVFPAPVTP